MTIYILGKGCAKCEQLNEMAHSIIEETGRNDTTIEQIRDVSLIMEYGVMNLPALVVDGSVKFSGRLPTRQELAQIITSAK